MGIAPPWGFGNEVIDGSKQGFHAFNVLMEEAFLGFSLGVLSLQMLGKSAEEKRKYRK